MKHTLLLMVLSVILSSSNAQSDSTPVTPLVWYSDATPKSTGFEVTGSYTKFVFFKPTASYNAVYDAGLISVPDFSYKSNEPESNILYLRFTSRTNDTDIYDLYNKGNKVGHLQLHNNTESDRDIVSIDITMDCLALSKGDTLKFTGNIIKLK